MFPQKGTRERRLKDFRIRNKSRCIIYDFLSITVFQRQVNCGGYPCTPNELFGCMYLTLNLISNLVQYLFNLCWGNNVTIVVTVYSLSATKGKCERMTNNRSLQGIAQCHWKSYIKGFNDSSQPWREEEGLQMSSSTLSLNT